MIARLLRIPQQLPKTALEVLRAPSQRRRDRLIDAGADERQDEEQEGQANRDVDGWVVQHPCFRSMGRPLRTTPQATTTPDARSRRHRSQEPPILSADVALVPPTGRSQERSGPGGRRRA